VLALVQATDLATMIHTVLVVSEVAEVTPMGAQAVPQAGSEVETLTITDLELRAVLAEETLTAMDPGTPEPLAVLEEATQTTTALQPPVEAAVTSDLATQTRTVQATKPLAAATMDLVTLIHTTPATKLLVAALEDHRTITTTPLLVKPAAKVILHLVK